MNQARPHGLAALGTVCVLAVILLGAGCGTTAPGGSPVLGAGSASDRTSTSQPGDAADSGIAGCTTLLGTHRAAASNYPKIRAQFAHSHWPDLRAAGMAYADLAVALQTARADGYETVWFYQRLSRACAKHGWNRSGTFGWGERPCARLAQARAHRDSTRCPEDHWPSRKGTQIELGECDDRACETRARPAYLSNPAAVIFAVLGLIDVSLTRRHPGRARRARVIHGRAGLSLAVQLTVDALAIIKP